MRIVLMNSGLGNQMFQYIFYRWLEIKTNDPSCVLDDSAFFNETIEHNGYELEKIFNLHPKRLSQVFNKEIWDEMLANRKAGVSIPQQLQDNGFNMFMFAETGDFKYNGNIILMPANHQDASIKYSVLNIIGNVYYHGYWITNDWFDDIFQEIKKEFKFPAITDEVNLKTMSRITDTDSCGIHIRRGDFIDRKWDLGPEYYNNAIKEIMRRHGKFVTYFVFSDDVEWCRENEEALGFSLVNDRLRYIEDNANGVTNYIDMQLLSECKYMIMSNSSFCYMAAILSNRLKGEINPTHRNITHRS